MSNVFLAFHERAMRSGIVNDRPDFGRELNSTLERFTTLARNATKATEGSDGEDHGEDDPNSNPLAKNAKQLPQAVAAAPGHMMHTRTDPQFAQMPLAMHQQRGRSGESSSSQSEEPNPEEYLPTVPMRDANLLLQRFADPTSSNYLPWMNELAPINRNPGAQAQYEAFLSTQPTVADFLDQAGPFDASAPLTLLDGPFSNQNLYHDPEPIGALSPLTGGLNSNGGMSTRMGLPYTFSFQETTFSRRLHRAATERAFHLISQADLRPQRFNNVFRLTLMYSTRDEVRNLLKNCLSKTVNESLDNSVGPFQHLGGAGTHYPRKDANGNLIPRPTGFHERRIGPVRTLVERYNKTAGIDLATCFANSDTANWEVLKGYEGEWFDADDVSGYLEERGVTIPAQASFVEGEVSDVQNGPISGGTEQIKDEPDHRQPVEFSEIFAPSAATLASMAAGNKPQAELESFPIHNIFQALPVPTAPDKKPIGAAGPDYFDFNAPLDTQLAEMEPGNFGASAWFDAPHASGPAAENPTPHPLSTGLSTPELSHVATTVSGDDLGAANEGMEWMAEGPLTRKRTVTVEVARLIDELIRRAVCIGRTPGFRRRDVDDALRASIISVF